MNAATATPVRVVIIDDVEWVRTMLTRLLNTMEDVEVCGTAADGASGVDVVLQERPDVVLMDISMPIMDGIAATRDIMARWPQARIVINSGYGDESLVEAAHEAGAVGYITKDQRPAKLVAEMLRIARAE